jgi:L-lactate dehydrogenase complex protein LldG
MDAPGAEPLDSRDVALRLQSELDRTLGALLPRGTRAALINYPNHHNVGDPALYLGTLRTLDRLGVRVTYRCEHRTYSRDSLRAELKRGTDVILINGGGNLGDQYPQQEGRERVLADFPNVPTIQLPQSIWFERDENRERFAAEMAEAVQATVACVEPGEVPQAVAAHLKRHNLPAAVRMGADPRLAALPWDRAPHLEIRKGASAGSDAVGLSHAFAGMAETGTLVLLSGPDNPTTVSFLPDTHIVVVAAADIVGDTETVWRLLRESFGAGHLPRTVNLITGPSRSADIEQTLLLGAHGPRALHVIVVG